jgi:hypothetical protein
LVVTALEPPMASWLIPNSSVTSSATIAATLPDRRLSASF